MSGIIKAIEPGSVAERAQLQVGDAVVSINGHVLRDVIDAQFYGADDELVFEIERNASRLTLHAPRQYSQALGIEFEHPTFDIDIRRCNNLCPFCFVLQNAPRMRRTLYIKDDDYRYSFLFGHYVTLTNLADEDWARLAEQRLTPLYVSVHATDLATRRVCLRNDKAPDVLAQLRWLAEHGIQAHTQLVVTPGMNDGARLAESVHQLAELHPNVLTVSAVPVGLTKYHKYGHRAHTPAEARATVEQVQAWQTEFKQKLGTSFVFLTDEWYLVSDLPIPTARAYEQYDLRGNGLGMVRDFLGEWQRVKKNELRTYGNAELRIENAELRKKDVSLSAFSSFSIPVGSQFHNATLATGALFYPTLKKTVAEFNRLTGMMLDVVSIANEHLGETITVAGLLSGADVIRQLRAGEPEKTGQLLILPRLMFDHPDSIALDDVSPLDIAHALNRPVALVDWMGDVVDALAGRNKLVFNPEADLLTVPVVREGGWAVEKYL